MKTLKDKINEGFFDNIGGKELIFLKDLKDTLDRWKTKTSPDKDFPINQLDRLCYKAQREGFNFDICIENNLKSDLIGQYATVIKFWNRYYEVSDRSDDPRASNNCWSILHNIKSQYIDVFNPDAANTNIYYICEYISLYIKEYGGRSKENVTFKVRISLDSPKHTKWM